METIQKRKLKFSRVLIILLIPILLCSFVVYKSYQDQKKKEAERIALLEKNKKKAYYNIHHADVLLEDDMGKRLYAYGKKNGEVYKIINNYDKYPEEVLLAFSYNYEWLDYVKAYPKKKNTKNKKAKIAVGKNVNTKVKQYDPAWGYAKYGDSNIAVSGCGPTSLALAASYLKKDSSITPLSVAKMSEKNGYYVSGIGTSWELMSEGAKDLGLESVALNSKDLSLIKKQLKKGKVIICSMLPGDFTKVGHFIIIDKVKGNKVHIVDCNSKKRTKYWEYDDVESQINNLWSIGYYE